MWKGFSICLCVVAAVVALPSAPLAPPGPALAASGTLTVETPLLQEPWPEAPVAAFLPAGATVSIDGPPVDGYYPVTADTGSGWMRGETLSVAKDVVAGNTGDELAADDPAALISDGQPGSEELATGDVAAAELMGGDVAADPALSGEWDAAPEPADQAPTQPIPEVAPSESVAVAPLIAPDDTPIAAPDAGPLGPASVAIEAPILAGPGAEYGLISTATSGSMVEQTGHQVNGFVTVRYGEVTGWTPIDHLGPPGAVADVTVKPEAGASAVATPVAEISEQAAVE